MAERVIQSLSHWHVIKTHDTRRAVCSHRQVRAMVLTLEDHSQALPTLLWSSQPQVCKRRPANANSRRETLPGRLKLMVRFLEPKCWSADQTPPPLQTI